ncbi:MAG TPA: winged helix-turn-helix domain-containing protein [Polyangiaceae bacterium]
MALSFGRFRLDEVARTLTLDSKPVALQPRVFDLLVYLVNQRTRVVTKEELLDELWRDVVVTEGSLQRAVSVLRSVLRAGGSPEAVRTFTRRGYRFCAEPNEQLPPELGPEHLGGTQRASASPLTTARELVRLHQWSDALSVFRGMPDSSALTADDYESWARCAEAAGHPHESALPLERAVAAHLSQREHGSSARCALALANLKLESRDIAVAKGWHQRAATLLEGSDECHEVAMHRWLGGRIALFEGHLADARTSVDAALAMARRIHDDDVECLALAYSGHLEVATGNSAVGLSLLDEAGAAALSGRVNLWACGIALCSVILGYMHQADYHRAGQWVDEFARWCERYGSYCFPALCRLHRGEVMALRGELGEAAKFVAEARELLSVAGPYAEGDAHRVIGEIHLSRGEYTAAEDAFKKAHQLGWNPMPGLAELLVARGKPDQAQTLLVRALDEPSWTDGQRRSLLLATLAQVAARTGDLERARRALAELDGTPSLAGAARGEAARARAQLALREQHPTDAVTHLERAVQLFIEARLPLKAARARLDLTELLLAAGDRAGADLELSAAEGTFRGIAAAPLLDECRQLRARLEAAD